MGVEVKDSEGSVDNAERQPSTAPHANGEAVAAGQESHSHTPPSGDSQEEVPPSNPSRPSSGSLRQSVALLGGVNLAAFAGGIVRQKVFAVALGPIGIGSLSLATAFLEVLLNLARMGAPTGLLREASRCLRTDDVAGAARIFKDVRRVQWVISGGLVLASIPLAPWASEHLFRGVLAPWMVPVIVLAVPLSIGGQLSLTMVNAVGNIPRLAVTKMAITGIALMVSLVAVVMFGLAGAVVQLVVAAGISLVLSRFAMNSVFDLKRPTEWVSVTKAKTALRTVFKVGGAEASSHVAISLNLLFFRAFLVGNLGLVENGIYQGVMGLSRQYTVALSGAVFVYLYPRISAAVADTAEARGKEIRSSLRFILAIAVPAGLVLLSTRDIIVPLLLSDEFSPMIPLIGFTAPGDLLALNVALFQIVLLAMGRMRAFLTLSIGGELLYLAFFVVGVGAFGLKGAVVGYLLWGIVLVPLYIRAVGLDGSWWGLGSEGPRLIVGVAMVGGLALLPYGTWPVRVLGALGVLGWVWVHRREIIPGSVK